MINTIFDITNLCINHDVDFEVWSGDSTTGSSRTAMLIQVNPPIRIDFGDAEHGKRASRVHLADNHKVNIHLEDVIDTIKSHKTSNVWHNQANASVNGIAFQNAGDSLVEVTGKVTSAPIEKYNEDTRYTSIVFDLTVQHFYRNLATGEIYESTPTVLEVESTHRTFPVEEIVGGEGLTITGYFKFPNQLAATQISK